MSTVRRVPVPDLCALWAESASAPMNICVLGVLDGPALAGTGSGTDAQVLDRVRRAVAASLHRTPMLRRVLRPTRLGEGRAVWVDLPALDVSDHVVLARARTPLPDEQSFLNWCAERSVIPLDRRRPLWRMDVVPGLPQGRVGVLVVLHHVVVDGLRGVELVGKLLDTAPREHQGIPPAWCAEAAPSASELVRDNLTRRAAAVRRFRPAALRHALHAARALAQEPGGPAPAPVLSGPIHPGRRMAALRFDLEELRAAAHGTRCTINELLLAGVTAGLRDVLVQRGECRGGLALRASVPVGALGGRSGGMLMAPLPVGMADPDERLRTIVEATRPRKERADQGVAGLVSMPASLARLGVLWARHAASGHINLYVTNVPGPPGPLYLAGARMFQAVPLAPLVAGVRLSVTALSYDGQFVVSLLADDVFAELPVLADGVRATLTERDLATTPREPWR